MLLSRVIKGMLSVLCAALILSACGGGSSDGDKQTTTAPVSPVVTVPSPVASDDNGFSVQAGQIMSIAAPGVLSNDSPGTDGGSLTVARWSQAAHGTVTIGSDGGFSYQPHAGYVGSDSFTYTVRNAGGQESTATVTVTVAAAPAIPLVALNDSYSIRSGSQLSVPAPGLLGNDTLGTSGDVTVATRVNASHGTVSVNSDGSFTYHPVPGYVGFDSFIYTIRNTHGHESSATVNLSVIPAVTQGIAAYLDLTQAAISKYQNNKQAAASYTFDDGLASSPAIASIFERYGVRATFYINPGIMPLDWGTWRTLAQKGHEVGNHSMNHQKLIDAYGYSDATLEEEINQAQRVIEQNVGVKPLTFAFPFNEFSVSTLAVVMQNHIATRLPGFDPDPGYRRLNVVSSSSVENANWHLNNVLQVGGWFSMGGHGIDGDGWEPVTSQYLSEHLAYATSLADRLWIDTFVNVARYRLCREKALPEVQLINAQSASVKLVGSYSSILCTEPLTVTIPVLAPAAGIQARTTSGAPVPLVQDGDRLLLNIRPGSEVHLVLP